MFQGNRTYTGNFKSGQRSGQGLLRYGDGSKYDGEWLEDDMHGTGTKYFANGKP